MIEERVSFLQQKARLAKRKVLEMCVNAGKGHLTSAYSCAEIVTVLYYGVMRFDSENPNRSGRDRFIMSKNHGSLMTYPILADLGYIDESELGTFMSDGTRLGGHSKIDTAGTDFAGGSLGIGLGVGVGLAYAAKTDNRDFLTFVLIGDGESYEGAIWEAAMVAAHNALGNLIVVLDRNRLCCTDFTERILKLEPITDKWTAFGWDVKEVDGHSIRQLTDVFDGIHEQKREKPLMIIANTTKGNGIDFMSDAPLYHGLAPEVCNIGKAFAQLEGVTA
jgi:transketolase